MPCFLQSRKQSQSPQLHLLMRSCWDLAIDGWYDRSLRYHVSSASQKSRKWYKCPPSPQPRISCWNKQAASYRASSLKIQTALCPPRPYWELIFYYYIWELDVSSLVWPARTVTRSVLYMLLTTKILHCGCLAVTALTACNSSAVMSLQLLEQRSTKPALRQSQNVLLKALGWFMMINGSL